MMNIYEAIESHNARKPSIELVEPPTWTWEEHISRNNIFYKSPDGIFLKKYSKHNNFKVMDICEREEFVSLLGRFAGVNIVNSWHFVDLPCPEKVSSNREFISEKCVVMNNIIDGKSVNPDSHSVLAKRQNNILLDLLVFMFWIGEEDKGLDDVLVSQDAFILIDNGLSGPGSSSVLRSAHPDSNGYRTQPDRIVKMCHWNKRSFVSFVLMNIESYDLLFAPAIVRRIEQMTYEEIALIVKCTGMKPHTAAVLFLRAQSLHEDYRIWISKALQVSCG